MVVACIGHWYESLLYVAPVLLVAVGLKVASKRAASDDDGLRDADAWAVDLAEDGELTSV